MNHDACRTRKLLLHKAKSQAGGGRPAEGFNPHPHAIYFRRGRVKCELASPRASRSGQRPRAQREADNEAKAAIAAASRRSLLSLQFAFINAVI